MNHQEMFGGARWIGGDPDYLAPNIRASFESPRVKRAEITICGLGYFLLYLNGQKVSDDLFVPVTSDYAPRPFHNGGKPFDEEWKHRCYCLKYDVTAFLKEGKNELGVSLGSGFYGRKLWSPDDESICYGQLRLCYRLTWEDEAGNCGEILSGPDARWHKSEIYECDFTRGEKQDLRNCPEDWSTADYSAWEPVSLLEPLDTDYLFQNCPADKIIRRIKPRLLKEVGDERLYDAGENITGWAVIRDESEEGENIQIRFSEEIDTLGNLHEKYMHRQYFDVISDGKGRLLHPHHTWNAFRYFTVTGKAKVEMVAVIHSDLPVTSRFSCSSPVLKWLYDAYLRTQLCNMHGGIPSDCPHLERRGYTGDGQLTCETVLTVLNHESFLRKWIGDIADCQDIHSGHVQNTAPYVRSGGGPGGWGCAIIVAPWQYYRQYGDESILQENYQGMRMYLDYLKAHSEKDLVTSDRAGEWCLGDWCVPGSITPERKVPLIPPPFVNTYFHVKSLDMMMQVEKALGKEIDPEWEIRRDAAMQAIIRDYFDIASGDFCGNVEGANAFALDIGLGDERTLRNLVSHYEETLCYDTGIFGTEIVTRVLFEKGYAPLAYALMNSEKEISFAGWMKAGATTLWEYWPRGYQRSLSHPMFGAVAKELFHYVLGIRQAEGGAGWKKAVIAPALVKELPQAEGKIQTPLGDIGVSYEAFGDQVKISVQIPSGMEAAFHWEGQEMPLQAGLNEMALTISQ